MDKLAEKVYALIRKIPKGKVTTYKSVGDVLGTRAYRAIGSVLANNPDIPKTPCHRVVRSDRTVGEYAMGQKNKIALLKNEGVTITNGRVDKSNILTYF